MTDGWTITTCTYLETYHHGLPAYSLDRAGTSMHHNNVRIHTAVQGLYTLIASCDLPMVISALVAVKVPEACQQVTEHNKLC